MSGIKNEDVICAVPEAESVLNKKKEANIEEGKQLYRLLEVHLLKYHLRNSFTYWVNAPIWHMYILMQTWICTQKVTLLLSARVEHKWAQWLSVVLPLEKKQASCSPISTLCSKAAGWCEGHGWESKLSKMLKKFLALNWLLLDTASLMESIHQSLIWKGKIIKKLKLGTMNTMLNNDLIMKWKWNFIRLTIRQHLFVEPSLPCKCTRLSSPTLSVCNKSPQFVVPKPKLRWPWRHHSLFSRANLSIY